MRLFFAITVPDAYKTKLLTSFPVNNLQNIRFTIAQQLHITVHFLGHTEKEKLQEILQQTAAIASAFNGFEMKFRSFKIINRQNKPVMIWAQMEQSEAFEALSMRFRNTFTTTENRKPNPHITMARIKKLKQLPFELPHLNPFSFRAASIELYESITHAAGAEYQLIKEWKLQ